MSIPEGAQTVTSEGRDLVSALKSAAEALGVEASHVAHKLDLTHFRSNTGSSVPKSTVKIVAWAVEEPVSAALLRPAPARSSEGRRGRDGGRDRGDSSKRSSSRDRADKPRTVRRPEETSTEASEFAATWFTTLLGLMGVEGEVSGSGNDERVHLSVRAERAGRIIGKRGATLSAIRHLLGLALVRHHGEFVVDVDVDDLREPEERRARDNDDASRGQGDEDGKRRRRRRRKGPRPNGGGGSSKYPEEKLQALARRAAEKAVETGQTITINLELNSYDRRVVHMEVAEVDGVTSHSEERDGVDAEGRSVKVKYVQVVPA